MSPTDETADQLRALAVQLSTFTDLLEQRTGQVMQQAMQSADTLVRTAHDAAGTSERVTTQAVAAFKVAASDAITHGVRAPLDEAGRTLRDSAQGMQQAVGDLERRLHASGKAYSAHAWKTFIASALASVMVIGVAVYMARNAQQEVSRAAWVGQINAAIANGRLAKCEGGGLCAHVGSRWVRLDQ